MVSPSSTSHLRADVSDTPEEEGSSLRKTGSTRTGQSGQGTGGRSKEPPFTQLRLKDGRQERHVPQPTDATIYRQPGSIRFDSPTCSSTIDHETNPNPTIGHVWSPSTSYPWHLALNIATIKQNYHALPTCRCPISLVWRTKLRQDLAGASGYAQAASRIQTKGRRWSDPSWC